MAGLRYVSDAAPGIRRRNSGRGFRYLNPDGTPVRRAATITRIRKLAIPPAYRDVWICTDPCGHIQALGRDARGRKQYRYHPRWREVRDETKFARMLAFCQRLPRIRRCVARDLRREGMPREKVIAAVVRLLERTWIRVGNEEYAKANGSFGLTTLRDRHVEVSAGRIVLQFRGKGGKLHRSALTDPRLARVIARSQGLQGEELFQYVDEAGERHPVDSGSVNDYLRRVSSEGFSAKDFRTWSGTLLAASALLATGPARDPARRKQCVLRAIDAVAAQLNNTRAVCRKYYIHPDILTAFEEGTLASSLRASSPARRATSFALSSAERSLATFLRARRAHHRGTGARPKCT